MREISSFLVIFHILIQLNCDIIKWVNKMNNKHLSTGKKFLIMTLFSISLVFFGIFLGFFIKFLYLGIINNDIDKIDMSLMSLVVSFIVGLVFFITLISILKFYDRNKKEKTKKWYIDKVIFSLIIVWIVISVVLFSFYTDENEIVYLIFSIVSFLIIGILTTPNVIIYAIKDMKNWKDIFSKNGNLGDPKKPSQFYKMQAPVSFERKIFFRVLRDQLLDIFTVIVVILFVLIGYLFKHSTNLLIKGDLLYAYFHTSSIRSEGYMFFGSVFLAAFWIPIFAYYITNAIYKLRVVKRHEYIVYHAIVDKVDTFKIRIHNSGFHYKYDYCSCVGIKAKDVNKTKATLIFVPDDLLLFPDK